MKKLLLAVSLLCAGSLIATTTITEIQQHIVDLYNAGSTIEQIVTQEVADNLGITLEELEEVAHTVFVPAA